MLPLNILNLVRNLHQQAQAVLKLLRLLVQRTQFRRQFVKLPIGRGKLRFLLWNREILP
jgi:hypothetical protein